MTSGSSLCKPPTSDQVRSMFTYADGVLYWKKRRYCVEGAVAGCLSPTGYHVIGLDGKIYLRSRLVWMLHQPSGTQWPTSVDHINGERSDDRMCNLRAVTHQENLRNQKMRSTNTSGATGVNYVESSGRWIASIKIGGKKKHLGSFPSRQIAIDVRRAAERSYGYHENHGLPQQHRKE